MEREKKKKRESQLEDVERDGEKGERRREERFSFGARPEAARLCPVWLGPARPRALDPAWSTAALLLVLFVSPFPLVPPSPLPPPPHPHPPPSLLQFRLLVLPSRRNASVWLMRRTHTRPGARAACSSPSSCIVPLPWPFRQYPSFDIYLPAAATTDRFFHCCRRRRRCRGLEHNAPRRAA